MAALREVFNRDVMLSYRMDEPLLESPMLQSGAFVTDAAIEAKLRGGDIEFSIPHVTPIDMALEANYSNTIYTDVASPRQITGRKSKARAAWLNEGFLESTLERHLLGVSPLQMMQGMINTYWQQQAEHRAVATVFGLKNLVMNNAGLKEQFVLDVSKTSSPTAASSWDVNQFIDAESLMHKTYRGRGSIVVHSKIAAKMRMQQLLERVTTSANLPPLEYYNGRLIIEDDEHTVVNAGASAQYITYLLGAGSFAVGSVAGPEDLELERTAATGNGSGHTALWTRRDMLIQPQGFDFIAEESTLTGGTAREAISASWTDLQKKENWALTGEANQTSVRFLITNL